MTSTLYALSNPPIKGSAYTFPVVLYQQADTKLIKTSPTLAAGDILVGYEGQAPTANIAVLPTTDASGRLEVALSAAEMNHNQVTVKFHDVTGAEWCDLLVTFSTVAAVTVGATDGATAAQVWDEILTGATHNIPTSAGRRLRQIASNIIIDGTVVSATENTVTLDAGASAVNGSYDPSEIIVTDPATGMSESRLILQYVGASRKAIVDRDWKVTPDGTFTYTIRGNPGREHVNEGLIRAATGTTAQLNANASTLDDAYNGQIVFIRSGTGEDQARRVIDYDGATQTVTVDAWGITPDVTSAYVMLPTGRLAISEIWTYASRTLTSFGTLVTDTAAAVWSYVTRTLTAGSSTAAEVWAYATRTLTQTAAAVEEAVSGSTLTIHRGDTFSATLTGLPANTGFVSIDFTVKHSKRDDDTQSVICIRKNASGLNDGLLYLNGATGTAGLGSIAVNSATSLTITLAAGASDDLTQAENLYYDVQYIFAASVQTATEGLCNVTADVRRAIS